MSKQTLKLNPEQIRIDLQIDVDLNTAMIRQPGLFAHYASLQAQFEREVNKVKTFIDVTEARVEREIRDQNSVTNTKMTEGQIRSMINTDPRVIKLSLQFNESQEQASLAKTTAEAFRHRRDMLVQLAFNYREEGKGALQVSGGNQTHAMEVRRERAQALRQSLEDTR